mmetsp:Transcript_79818/g.191517  ORF Transcript_79818/g.191517 Transcript_79818/m.191517 type:complete len:219 (-) Transcript_79818:829-1485(-)
MTQTSTSLGSSPQHRCKLEDASLSRDTHEDKFSRNFDSAGKFRRCAPSCPKLLRERQPAKQSSKTEISVNIFKGLVSSSREVSIVQSAKQSCTLASACISSERRSTEAKLLQAVVSTFSSLKTCRPGRQHPPGHSAELLPPPKCCRSLHSANFNSRARSCFPRLQRLRQRLSAERSDGQPLNPKRRPVSARSAEIPCPNGRASVSLGLPHICRSSILS